MAPALISVPQVNQHCPPQEMNRELCHQQEALWELLTTELIYLRKLKIMTDVSHLQPHPPPQPGSLVLSPSSQSRRAGMRSGRQDLLRREETGDGSAGRTLKEEGEGLSLCLPPCL